MAQPSLPPAGRLALPWGYELFHARRDAPPRRAGAVLADASQGHADPHRSARRCWDLLSFLRAQKGEVVDVELFVGKRERLPVRLIAVRVSPEEAKRRRQRAQERITHPPKVVKLPCQASAS